jgi:hypothetical protein
MPPIPRGCAVRSDQALRIVAEDEAIIRLDLPRCSTEAGYEVVGQAGDGEQAVALVRVAKPDLVLMDVKMPVMDGISAAAGHRQGVGSARSSCSPRSARPSSSSGRVTRASWPMSSSRSRQ